MNLKARNARTKVPRNYEIPQDFFNNLTILPIITAYAVQWITTQDRLNDQRMKISRPTK